ncbi:MAG: aspartate aminotransferase [Nitrospinae bacterium]|nr:aspartate aminotransferase [Nitrospinota bacterium]
MNFNPQDYAASRLDLIPFSGIRKVFDAVSALEAQGKDVVHWQIGRPDFDTPNHIKEAAKTSLDRGDVHYAPSTGIPILRKGIAERTEIDTGVSVDPNTQVIVMAGANEGILVSMLALINPGDEVIIADPNWHHYKSCVSIAGGVPIEVETKEEHGFNLRSEDIQNKINSNTKMICLTSPGNPTGCVIPEDELQKIASLAIENDLIVISDEIYSRIYFGEGPVAPSIFSQPGMSERTVIINGFSKFFSMDGWRLGWTIASPEMSRHLLKIRQYTTVCVNTFIQHGAAAAISEDQAPMEEMKEAFSLRRNIIVDGLKSIKGVSLALPTGAFYAFPNVKAFGANSSDVADYLLNEHAIATIDGGVFGKAGEGYLRIAYSCSSEECEKGVERLKTALETI